MNATLLDNDGCVLSVEIPSQRSFPEFVIWDSKIYQRMGSVLDEEYQEVSGRVVTGIRLLEDPPAKE